MLKGFRKQVRVDGFCSDCNVNCTVPATYKCQKEQRIIKSIIDRWNNKRAQMPLIGAWK